MSRESERVAIVQFFTSNWNMSTYPTKLPNQSFTEPENKIFCHLLIIRNRTLRLTIGRTARRRALGILQFDIYTPVDKGEKLANDIEDLFTPLFDEKMLMTTDSQKIQFQEADPITFGPTNGKYRVTVRVPFYREFIRTAPQ